MKRNYFIRIFLTFLLILTIVPASISQASLDTQNAGVHAKKKSTATKTITITEAERNAYFSNSAFIGSSIGVGLKMYMNSKGSGYLGNPVMMVQGCYSFANDAAKSTTYKIGYNGHKYKAKDAIAAAHVKRVFICMGTNDLWKEAKSTANDYMKYIEGIQARNPGIVIFIESTPPMCSASCRGHLTNASIKTLNDTMKAYCDKKKDVYFIDIAKGITASDGGLIRSYSSDGYVHLTSGAYNIWMNNVIHYVDNLLIAEKKAKAAVHLAEKKTTKKNCDKALKYTYALKDSTVKTGFMNRLNKLSYKKDFKNYISKKSQ